MSAAVSDRELIGNVGDCERDCTVHHEDEYVLVVADVLFVHVASLESQRGNVQFERAVREVA